MGNYDDKEYPSSVFVKLPQNNAALRSVKLIALLGNPGSLYQNNRHNVGRLFAESFHFSLQWQQKFKGYYAQHEALHFLMPETFMNLSGKSVGECAHFFKLQDNEILVVHDELELPLGSAAFKEGGGLGGHNGLRSIRDCIGSNDFLRLRIGIGRPGGKKEPGADISAWVLSNFRSEDKPVLESVFQECSAILFKS
ncbi:MAG: aminoacyl-tRNA hydrolase [Termitinemataceae bacterium]|nr:MAG: aminoacyl-tRNA hydrolase [Termitinemataceae bacterium]